MSDRKIVWEKWFCPVDEEFTEEEFNPEEHAYVDTYVVGDDDFRTAFELPFVRTPLGPYFKDDPFMPSKMFDCWIAHTNFPLSKSEIKEKLIRVPGIEVLKIISRYRFFIGVGKLFTIRETAQKVQEALRCNNNAIEEELVPEDEFVDFLVSDLQGRPEKVRWAIIVSEDGSVDCVSTSLEDDDEYEQHLAKLLEVKDVRKVIQSNAEGQGD